MCKAFGFERASEQPLPWLVTMRKAGGQRFIIDGRNSLNPDIFFGYKINGDGSVQRQALTTGEGARLGFHRSYFIEELPA